MSTADERAEIAAAVTKWVAAGIAFAYVWFAAVQEAGWVVGIGIGWIPALLAGLVAYWAALWAIGFAIFGGIVVALLHLTR